MNDQQYLNVSRFNLSSKGHFPVICKTTDEVCDSLKEYLLSEHWQNIRSDFYSLNQQCVCAYCNDKTKLHLHHQTYERIGREYLSDLIQLCESCHNFVHVFIDNYGKPPTPTERDSRWEPQLIKTSPKFQNLKGNSKKNKRKEIIYNLFGQISNSKLNRLMDINGLGKRAYMTKIPLIFKIAEKWKETRKIDLCKIKNPNTLTCHTKNIFAISPKQNLILKEDDGWPL